MSTYRHFAGWNVDYIEFRFLAVKSDTNSFLTEFVVCDKKCYNVTGFGESSGMVLRSRTMEVSEPDDIFTKALVYFHMRLSWKRGGLVHFSCDKNLRNFLGDSHLWGRITHLDLKQLQNFARHS